MELMSEATFWYSIKGVVAKGKTSVKTKLRSIIVKVLKIKVKEKI